MHDIHIPTEAVGCRDTQCTNVNHIKTLNTLYSDIVNSLIQAGDELSQSKKKSYTNKPGWAEYVDTLYDTSREVRHIMVNTGKPKQRPVYDLHIKFIKINENVLHTKALAKKLAELNPKAFWHEIKTINNCNTPLPVSVEGVSG